MTDDENRLHALLMPGYAVRPVEGVAFDPARESMTIIGTLLNWTLCVADDDTERYYAVSADDLSLLDTMRRTVPLRHIPGLSFTSPPTATSDRGCGKVGQVRHVCHLPGGGRVASGICKSRRFG